jgi:exosortase
MRLLFPVHPVRAIRVLPLFALAGSFALLYAPVLARLAGDWTTDDNYSHGFLIPPLAAYLTWERRTRLAALPLKPAATGLIVVAGSLAVLIAGRLGAELFLTRMSLLGTLAGTTVFLYGWAHLRVLAFPLACMLLMIPLPSIVFNQIAFPLQLWASRFGEAALNAASIPVLREGNVIVLANTTLEVAEACSGIRSLVSLLTLAIVLGYFTESRALPRVVLALSAVPVAIVANGLRVAATGVAAHYYGAAAAQGVLHTSSGWVVFVVSFGAMLGIQRAMARLRSKDSQIALARTANVTPEPAARLAP